MPSFKKDFVPETSSLFFWWVMPSSLQRSLLIFIQLSFASKNENHKLYSKIPAMKQAFSVFCQWTKYSVFLDVLWFI